MEKIFRFQVVVPGMFCVHSILFLIQSTVIAGHCEDKYIL